jgi:hypothetical protein
MSDNNLYRSNVAKLKDFYKLASDNAGEQQFYVFLYGYVKTIDDNEVLKNAANIFWFTGYLNDHKDDKELHGLLESMTATGDKPSNEQKTENLLALFKLVLTDDIKEARLYYSWILLYFVFYSVYRLSPEALKEGSFSGVDLKDFLGTSVSMDKLKEMNSNLRRTFKNGDSNSTPFSRDMFATCLHIFHTEFINWLPESVGSLLEVQPSEKRTEVELSFDDIYPVVIDHQSNQKYKFARMSEQNRPYKIIRWCLKYADGKFATSQMLSKHFALGSKGLIDDLHKSIFNVKDGDLRFFISKAKPSEITVSSKILIDPNVFNDWVAKGVEVIPISE